MNPAQAPALDAANYFQETPALDWRPILDIHRGDPDGFVGFTSIGERYDGSRGWREHGMVRVRDVREWLPGILTQFVARDGYFSVNTFRTSSAKPWKRTGLHYPLRQGWNCLELGACYADLDVNRPDEEHKRPGASMTWQDAQIEALRRQRDGLIPPFSMMACSGRGVYLLWLLKDSRDPDRLPPGIPALQRRYKAINKALHQRLYGLGVDQTNMVTQVIRVPGSLHTGVMRRVTYSVTVQGDDGGRLAYTLPELESMLALDAAPVDSLPDSLRRQALLPAAPVEIRTAGRPTKERGSRPHYRAQYERTNALRAADLATIEDWRGGWRHGGTAYPDGHVSIGREKLLRLYADWLHGSGVDRDQVQAAVATMAANCKPSYPSDSKDAAIDSIMADTYGGDPAKHFKNVPNSRLLDWLGINAGTDGALLDSLQTILPANVKRARRDSTPKQADFTAERRALIQEIRERHAGNVPALRPMAAALAALSSVNPKNNRPWSHEIIRADYDALGIPPPTAGRRRKSQN